MASLDEFVALARDMDQTKFVATFPHPFLLSEGTSGTGTGVWASPEAPTVTNSSGRAVAKKKDDPAKSPVILPIVRGDQSKHATIITVGRGEGCDVRLVHPLVSKRHAYFTQTEQGWFIADADSSNGTFADGIKLEAHKHHLLADSEVLRFGPEVKYRFFRSAALYKYLYTRAHMKP
jgi:pSer/pThr/pTyr-binding forkhead associated (FHA) protein